MRFTQTTNRVVSIFATMMLLVVAAAAQSSERRICQSVGGMLMTNLGAVDQATTMGTATGDLKGAVAATILSTEANGNTLVFHVQHHWVTESGDTLNFDPATATTTLVAPGIYAVVSYPTHIAGGTGRYKHAWANLTAIGEADLANGQIVLRYSGQLCFRQGD